jgi:hypothetical protein
MRDHSELSADEALQALTRMFCSPLTAKKQFRCGIDGPTDFDLFFESICDSEFGHDPNSAYKCWVRRIYEIGLISFLPDDWRG